MKDFRTLKVWEKAHAIVLGVYDVTAKFPPDERFSLTSQMRRSAQSIPTNLAEGCGAGSDLDFARFAQISMRSSCELEYQFILARDLGYLPAATYAEFDKKVVEVKRMLTALMQRLRSES